MSNVPDWIMNSTGGKMNGLVYTNTTSTTPTTNDDTTTPTTNKTNNTNKIVPTTTAPSYAGTYTLGTEAGANYYNQVKSTGNSQSLSDGTVLSLDANGNVIATRNGTVYSTNVTYKPSASSTVNTNDVYTLGTEKGANYYEQVKNTGTSITLGDGTTLRLDANGNVVAERNGTVYNTNVTYVPQTDKEEEYLREQKAAELQAQLSNLRTAYNKSMRGYEAEEEEIPILYTDARNQTAAQNAVAKKNFDEQAVASGLNTGTSGQAALSRSAVYSGLLADLIAEENKALNEVARKKAELTSEYNSAVAATKSANEAELASALYQKLLADEESAAKAEAAARADAQTRLDNHLAAGGSAADVPELVAASGWSAAEIASREAYWKTKNQQAVVKTGSGNVSKYAPEVILAAGADAKTASLDYWQNMYDNYPELFVQQVEAQSNGEEPEGPQYYKVNDDGKAPVGLKVGDFVVTSKGTYEITKVNADGSYDENLYDKKNTTKNFSGTYADNPETIAYNDAVNMMRNGMTDKEIAAELARKYETLPEEAILTIVQKLAYAEG